MAIVVILTHGRRHPEVHDTVQILLVLGSNQVSLCQTYCTCTCSCHNHFVLAGYDGHIIIHGYYQASLELPRYRYGVSVAIHNGP